MAQQQAARPTKDQILEALGIWLKSRRERAGLSQRIVAMALGLSLRQWQYAEQGTKELGSAKLLRFMQLTGADPIEVVELIEK